MPLYNPSEGGSGGASIAGGAGTIGTLAKFSAADEIADVVGVTQGANNQLSLTSQAAGDVPFKVIAHASQTGDLAQWLASNGTTIKLRVTKDGYLQGDTANQQLILNSGVGAKLQFTANSMVSVGTNDVVITSGGGYGIYWNAANSAALEFSSLSSAANASLGSSSRYWHNLYLQDFIQMLEQTAPSAPPANGVRIYAVDNGAGKTRLMAIFPTGAAQQLAIEP